MQIANVTIQLPFAIWIFLKPHWASSNGNIPDHNISFIAARSNGAKQHAKSQKRYLILQPSTKGSRSRSFIIFDRYCHDHTNLYIGGKPNDNGAVKIPFNKEQVPLPQGPHAEGRNNQADDERGGAFYFFSHTLIFASLCQWDLFQKWLSNLLDFFNPPSVYVKHVCFVNFTQWVKKLPHLAFPAAAAAATVHLLLLSTFIRPLLVYLLSLLYWRSANFVIFENLPRAFCNAESASIMTRKPSSFTLSNVT